MLDDEMKWKNLPPMPKPNSHIESAWAIVNHSIVIAGGTTDKHPITKKMILCGELLRFDLDTLVLILYHYFMVSPEDIPSILCIVALKVHCPIFKPDRSNNVRPPVL